MKAENLPALPETTGHATRLNVDEFDISQSEQERQPSSLNLNDILFVLFRHKWKIVLFALAGMAAAAAVFFLFPPVYESRAKLLVRYVVERSAVDAIDAPVKTLGTQGETLMNSEVEILTSLDLATQVAEAVGVERVLGYSGDGGTKIGAARNIVAGLTVTALKGSNILIVSYKNRDPGVARQVLQELVKRYFDKHLEVHRSVGAFDFVTKQTAQLQAELNQTEQELKQLKDKAGITSLAESTTALATELTKAQEELDAAEAELASQQARMKEVEQSLVGAAEAKQSNNTVPQVSSEVVREYQALVNREAQLRQMQTDLLARYTPQNRIVKVKQAQIDGLVNQRRDLEKKYPGLLATVSSAASSDGNRLDPVSERARLAEIESKRDTLRSRLSGLQERAKMLSDVGPRIAQLERTKEVLETNYKYYGASLEKARIDETLDPARMPNISVVQTPSPAVIATDGVGKVALALGGGGVALGFGIALLIELVLDRTVKRSFELERRLRIPLMLSIPNLAGISRLPLRLHNAGEETTALSEGGLPNPAAFERGSMLRPFCEALRDRLALYFELNGMAQKPKLVAVAGLSKNAGASTLAAGLAASLSENGDGKVLLVDQQFAPKRFYNMLAQFKESDLEYVIFDMPAVTETSATLSMAGFMDKVLLVVEAEKSNRDAVKRAYTKLSARTKVSVVFNKSRSYGPNWLQDED
jgi:succinoglycan biosynthesis transport protein ExoP